MNGEQEEYRIAITRKPHPEREILFTCVICDRDVEKSGRFPMRPVEREPICKSCVAAWGRRESGPVFNRQNWHTLRQVSAVINAINWEIKNGNRRHR